MFFQKDIETMSRKDIEKLQLERLKWLVKYCMDNVPFYNKRLTEAGVTDDKIKQLSDIQYIPYTTKADMRDTYPFGLFAVPMKKIERIHASSGTTGKPTVVGYTKRDLDNWGDCVARLVTAVGASDETIVQIAFGYGLFTGALGLHYGLEKIGATVIPTSSGNTEKQIMLMQDFGTNTLVSTPSYAQYIGELAKEMAEAESILENPGNYTPEYISSVEATLNTIPDDLRDFLLEHKDDIEEIEFCGLCTDICVVSNALMARQALPGVKITVDASCCAGSTIERHNAALEVMDSCQIDIKNS